VDPSSTKKAHFSTDEPVLPRQLSNRTIEEYLSYFCTYRKDIIGFNLFLLHLPKTLPVITKFDKYQNICTVKVIRKELL